MFRFSIRDLLLVTAIVALAVGWWLDKSKYRGLHEKLEEENASISQKLEDSERMLKNVIFVMSRKSAVSP